MKENIKLAFFGTSEFSVEVLNELKVHGLIPSLIICTEDKPKGRKMIVTPPPTKVWAIENGVEVLQPKTLKNNPDLTYKLQALSFELFLVASYGKIIPKEIFDLPLRKTLNIHPSMLPKYRGASPLEAQILNDEKDIGVSIMVIEEGVDSGPILVQKKVEIENWPINTSELEAILAREGARLFTHVLPEWMDGSIDGIMQDDSKATFCEKFKKSESLLDLDGEPYKNLLKVKAFFPYAHFFYNKKYGDKIRIIVREAKIENNKFIPTRVVPEGKTEMSYEDFLRGQNQKTE